MAMKWMMGTTAAALIAAGPAFAQSTAEPRTCALSGMTDDMFRSLDRDGDGRLTLAEYRACLDAETITGADRRRLEDDFASAAPAGSAGLAFAEVERIGADGSTARADVGQPGAPKGTITVTEPGPDVTVRQPSPEVAVSQAPPTVSVQQHQPEVAVATPPPAVEVTEAQPRVSVDQPEPRVSVEQPQPEVSVSQPDPSVSVTPGQPAVNVATAEPDVSVATPDPEVRVEQPELAVDVEQGQPAVAVEAGEPDVAVRRSTGVDNRTETASIDASRTDAATAGPATAEPYRIAVDDLVGKSVYNANGDEIGKIETIVLDAGRNAPAVIVKAGGFLGLGGREVAFAYDNISVSDDRVVLDTAMSESDIKNMPRYDRAAYEPLPEEMVAR
jgi:sporulation protein YlmC with PRC-barrel domain